MLFQCDALQTYNSFLRFFGAFVAIGGRWKSRVSRKPGKKVLKFRKFCDISRANRLEKFCFLQKVAQFSGAPNIWAAPASDSTPQHREPRSRGMSETKDVKRHPRIWTSSLSVSSIDHCRSLQNDLSWLKLIISECNVSFINIKSTMMSKV